MPNKPDIFNKFSRIRGKSGDSTAGNSNPQASPEAVTLPEVVVSAKGPLHLFLPMMPSSKQAKESKSSNFFYEIKLPYYVFKFMSFCFHPDNSRHFKTEWLAKPDRAKMAFNDMKEWMAKGELDLNLFKPSIMDVNIRSSDPVPASASVPPVRITEKQQMFVSAFLLKYRGIERFDILYAVQYLGDITAQRIQDDKALSSGKKLLEKWGEASSEFDTNLRSTRNFQMASEVELHLKARYDELVNTVLRHGLAFMVLAVEYDWGNRHVSTGNFGDLQAARDNMRTFVSMGKRYFGALKKHIVQFKSKANKENWEFLKGAEGSLDKMEHYCDNVMKFYSLGVFGK